MDNLRSRAAAASATLRIMGSGALSITQVALGRACACVIDEYHDIDHAAALCIATEAGRTISHRNDGPFTVGVVL